MQEMYSIPIEIHFYSMCKQGGRCRAIPELYCDHEVASYYDMKNITSIGSEWCKQSDDTYVDSHCKLRNHLVSRDHYWRGLPGDARLQTPGRQTNTAPHPLPLRRISHLWAIF